MSYEISTIVQAIETSADPFFDLTRFCLSDKVERSVDTVTKGKGSPAGYARLIMKKNGKRLFDIFGKEHLEAEKKLPEDIRQAWVYDRLLESSTFFRVSKTRPRTMSDASALVATALPYSLTINDRHCPASSYAGLTAFKNNAQTFVDSYGIQCHLDSVGIIHRMISAVGDIEESTWVLHDPVWYKALSNNEERLRIFRGLLYTAIIAHVSDEAFVEMTFDSTMTEVMEAVRTFIELKEDEGTTVADIVKLLGSVEHFAYEIKQHTMLYSLYQMPYDYFTSEHRHVFGDRYEVPFGNSGQEVIMRPVEDKSEWVFLRNLGEEYSPEKIIQTDITPYAFVRSLMDDHQTTLFEGPLRYIAAEKGIQFPDKLPKLRGWIDGLMADMLHCSMIERRILQLNEEVDLSEAGKRTKNTSHILLVFDDGNDQRAGLSLVKDLIWHHFQANVDNLTDRESESVALLLWAWDRLALAKPNRMDKQWKSILNNKDHRHRLRSLMFTILEAINIPRDENFEDYLGVSRDWFFNFIENFCEQLSESPEEEEITEIFETMPMLNRTFLLTQWDQCLWSMPFGAIPPVEED